MAALVVETKPGWMVDCTTETETSNGTSAERVVSRRLNAGAERALGSLVTNGLDHTIHLIRQYREGKCDVKQVSNAIGTLAVDLGEGYLLGLSGQLAAATKELGDAVPWALTTILVARVMRSGVAWATKPELTAEQAQIQAREGAWDLPVWTSRRVNRGLRRRRTCIPAASGAWVRARLLLACHVWFVPNRNVLPESRFGRGKGRYVYASIGKHVQDARP